MAHFAELNDDNTILRVLVIDDNDTKDDEGIEKESIGVAFLQKLFGENTRWIKTSYNNNIRKIFATAGGTYDELNDVFIPPKPDKWHIWNQETWTWDTPIPAPTGDNIIVFWNSEKGEWEIKEITK